MIRIKNTEEVQFVLSTGDVIHACLDDNAGKGATRLSLYSDNGNLIVLPIESRCVKVSTQTQFAAIERGRA